MMSSNFFLNCIMLIEIMIFFAWTAQDVFFGEIFTLKRDIKQIALVIHNLKSELHVLDQMINNHKRYPFYAEKIAREHLQMARKDDVLFYVAQ